MMKTYIIKADGKQFEICGRKTYELFKNSLLIEGSDSSKKTTSPQCLIITFTKQSDYEFLNYLRENKLIEPSKYLHTHKLNDLCLVYSATRDEIHKDCYIKPEEYKHHNIYPQRPFELMGESPTAPSYNLIKYGYISVEITLENGKLFEIFKKCRRLVDKKERKKTKKQKKLYRKNNSIISFWKKNLSRKNNKNRLGGIKSLFSVKPMYFYAKVICDYLYDEMDGYSNTANTMANYKTKMEFSRKWFIGHSLDSKAKKEGDKDTYLLCEILNHHYTDGSESSTVNVEEWLDALCFLFDNDYVYQKDSFYKDTSIDSVILQLSEKGRDIGKSRMAIFLPMMYFNINNIFYNSFYKCEYKDGNLFVTFNYNLVLFLGFLSSVLGIVSFF